MDSHERENLSRRSRAGHEGRNIQSTVPNSVRANHNNMSQHLNRRRGHRLSPNPADANSMTVASDISETSGITQVNIIHDPNHSIRGYENIPVHEPAFGIREYEIVPAGGDFASSLYQNVDTDAYEADLRNSNYISADDESENEYQRSTDNRGYTAMQECPLSAYVDTGEGDYAYVEDGDQFESNTELVLAGNPRLDNQ